MFQDTLERSETLTDQIERPLILTVKPMTMASLSGGTCNQQIIADRFSDSNGFIKIKSTPLRGL